MAEHEERRDLSAIEELEQLRDTARLQAHLLKEDLKDEWENLEERRKELERRIGPVQHAAKESLRDVDSATRDLLHSLTEGYKRIVKAVQK